MNRQRARIVNIVLITTTFVAGLLAVGVIILPLLIRAFDETYTIPDHIRDWGGIIIGFYFGSFISLVDRLLNAHEDNNTENGNNSGTKQG